jgi:hypothetical protein
MAIRTPGTTGSPDFSLGGFLIMLQAQIFDRVPFYLFFVSAEWFAASKSTGRLTLDCPGPRGDDGNCKGADINSRFEFDGTT